MTILLKTPKNYRTIESLEAQLAAAKIDIKTEPDDNEAFHRDILDEKYLVDSLQFEINQLEEQTIDDKSTIIRRKNFMPLKNPTRSKSKFQIN